MKDIFKGIVAIILIIGLFSLGSGTVLHSLYQRREERLSVATSIKQYPVYDGEHVEEFIDSETGVHYLLWDGGYNGGMSVRYNADGTIMVD